MYECERRRGIKRKIFTVLLFIIAVACTACAFAACFGTHTLKYLADNGGYVEGETTQYVRDGEDGAAVTAVAGWTYAYRNNNVYYAPVYDYEVAYEHKFGWSWYWDRRHTDFETLAPELNEGQGIVWEHCKEGDPPTLIWWRQMNEELFGDIGDI